ncbi:MAG: hypothetical protein HKL86_07580 [Acidimicrobiaceae bacterium]|nr:hypothetical protein [Acidimicrobiaceae bacterium]
MSRPSSTPRRSLGRVATLIVTLVGTLVATSPSVGATTIRTSSEGVSATLTFTGSYPQSHHPWLTISRSATVIYRQPVTSAWCSSECWPASSFARQSALHVVRLGSGVTPSVVLDLYTGGAHCCVVEQVFSVDQKSGRIVKVERNFGDPGARLVRLGRTSSFDFVSADDSFAYAFTDYAASGLPVEVLSFSHHAFHDVTRSFPTLITRDALQWQKAFNDAKGSGYQDTVGIVAAWAADEDMLGHFSKVRNFLNAQLKAGHLNSGLSPIEPGGQRFVVALEKFLRLHHYSN